VDGELLGDPLDLKMFEFTGWSYEEENTRRVSEGNSGDNDEEHGASKSLSPPVVRPPGGKRYGDSDETEGEIPLELGVFKSFEFVSQLRRASVVVKQYRAAGGDVYVKGAPECMRDICNPDTCKPIIIPIELHLLTIQ